MSKLKEKLIVVRFSASQWKARKVDRRAGKEVTDAHHTREGLVKVYKDLMPESAPEYQAVTQAIASARTVFYKRTLPWGTTLSERVVPAEKYLDLANEIRARAYIVDAAAEKFAKVYKALKDQAEIEQNSLFSESDYPKPEEIVSKFSIKLHAQPLAEGSDFRVDFADEYLTELEKQCNADIKASLDGAMAEVWERLLTTVKTLGERLADPKGILKDNLVINLRDLCESLPAFNLTDNAKLEKMRTKCLAQLDHDPDTLRSDKALRAQVAAKAKKIEKELSAFMR